MATTEERQALLAVSCPWCGVAPGEECRTSLIRQHQSAVTRRSRVRPISTLDGGAHDARWQRALGRSADVVVLAVPVPVAHG